MNRLILSIVLVLSLGCNWKDIKKVDGGFLYPAECHVEVGKTIKANKNYKLATDKLLESIKLKDLALDTADTRIIKWRNESYNQHERLLKASKFSRLNDTLYFSLGIIFTSLAVIGAGQLK